MNDVRGVGKQRQLAVVGAREGSGVPGGGGGRKRSESGEGRGEKREGMGVRRALVTLAGLAALVVAVEERAMKEREAEERAGPGLFEKRLFEKRLFEKRDFWRRMRSVGGAKDVERMDSLLQGMAARGSHQAAVINNYLTGVRAEERAKAGSEQHNCYLSPVNCALLRRLFPSTRSTVYSQGLASLWE